MNESMNNIAGVRICGVEPDQVPAIVTRLEAAGAVQVKLVTTRPAPNPAGTLQACITGRCFSDGSGCFAEVARDVLNPEPSVPKFHVDPCVNAFCKKQH